MLIIEAGFDERLGDHGREQLDMRPAGDLGNNPTKPGVQADLARHHRRQDLFRVDNDGGCCLITRRLDTEHASTGHRRSASSTIAAPSMLISTRANRCAYSGVLMSCAHMIKASSPVSS